jgi:hypothetical protein
MIAGRGRSINAINTAAATGSTLAGVIERRSSPTCGEAR